jgi:2-dehydro-3-deoxyphosphooctonate aldolase (KDO 8-P synthase)
MCGPDGFESGGSPIVKTNEVRLGDLRLGGGNDLFAFAGPCVVEGHDVCLDTARQVKTAAEAAGVPLVFKASFDKANRSSVASFRSPGFRDALATLKAVKEEVGVPIVTDIHETSQAEPVAEVADILQIPALLCRQTDLLIAAGRTGRIVNIKKGHFMAPGDMGNAVEKVRSTGNESVLLTERGTSFGYRYLVSDLRGLAIMREIGCPVVFDATHSVQMPGGLGNRSGGERRFVPLLARAAVAAGVDGLFLEVHPDPDKALSDGPNMLPVTEFAPLLTLLKRIHAEVRAVATT